MRVAAKNRSDALTRCTRSTPLHFQSYVCSQWVRLTPNMLAGLPRLRLPVVRGCLPRNQLPFLSLLCSRLALPTPLQNGPSATRRRRRLLLPYQLLHFSTIDTGARIWAASKDGRLDETDPEFWHSTSRVIRNIATRIHTAVTGTAALHLGKDSILVRKLYEWRVSQWRETLPSERSVSLAHLMIVKSPLGI